MTRSMPVVGVKVTALANAQSAGDDEAAARVAARYGVMLDTISVYADRNARQALDLPQNVTVIGRQELDERMVRDVQDLVAQVVTRMNVAPQVRDERERGEVLEQARERVAEEKVVARRAAGMTLVTWAEDASSSPDQKMP